MGTTAKKAPTRAHVRAAAQGTRSGRAAGIQLAPEVSTPAPTYNNVRNGAYLHSEAFVEHGTLNPTRGNVVGTRNVSVIVEASVSASRNPERAKDFGSTFLTFKIGEMVVTPARTWHHVRTQNFEMQDLRPADIDVLARALAELHAQMVEDGTLAFVTSAPAGGE